jgi:hypothetical protein
MRRHFSPKADAGVSPTWAEMQRCAQHVREHPGVPGPFAYPFPRSTRGIYRMVLSCFKEEFAARDGYALGFCHCTTDLLLSGGETPRVSPDDTKRCEIMARTQHETRRTLTFRQFKGIAVK